MFVHLPAVTPVPEKHRRMEVLTEDLSDRWMEVSERSLRSVCAFAREGREQVPFTVGEAES